MPLEDALKTQARFTVIELLLTVLCTIRHAESDDPWASLARMRTSLIEKAREKTLPGVDAVYSDAYSAELEAALDDALNAQKELLTRFAGSPPAP